MTSPGVPDPLPEDARAHLERLARRWQQLPLDRALRHAPAVSGLAQSYADRLALASSRPPRDLPDLGPATAYAQLAATAYDLTRLDPQSAPGLTQDLARLRATID